jgi:hypothetical protein
VPLVVEWLFNVRVDRQEGIIRTLIDGSWMNRLDSVEWLVELHGFSREQAMTFLADALRAANMEISPQPFHRKDGTIFSVIVRDRQVSPW